MEIYKLLLVSAGVGAIISLLVVVTAHFAMPAVEKLRQRDARVSLGHV